MEGNHWNTKEGILCLLEELVQIPSVSGTEGENAMWEKLQELLLQIPYFRNNSMNILTEDVRGIDVDRKTIGALYRSHLETKKTIILLSHYDVVGVEDYGPLMSLAFSPHEYTQALHNEELTEEVLTDLQSGDWLFARGIMDMKAGLALQLALLSEICYEDKLEANVLLLATPDEERYSEGMLAGVNLLHKLQEVADLSLDLCICSEPSFTSYPGDQTKYIYTGSVGKLLPLIYCIGKETHVGEPLAGLNAAWMASALAHKLEWSNEFLEKKNGESNPLPTCLKVTDLKEEYNVQTAFDAYILLNILTLSQSPQVVLEKIVKVAEVCSSEMMERLQARLQNLDETRRKELIALHTPKVYTFSELYNMGVNQFGEVFISTLKEAELEASREREEFHLASLRIVQAASSFFKALAPFYVILFSPPYYPHVYVNGKDEKEKLIQQMVKSCIHEAKEKYDTTIVSRSYFQGLSDVSYCRLLDGEEAIEAIKREMPVYGRSYHIPLELIKSLNIPTINIGPFGKDAHKHTERLQISFSTEIAPQLLKYAVYHF